jgi:hypothetical protein
MEYAIIKLLAGNADLSKACQNWKRPGHLLDLPDSYVMGTEAGASS